MDHRKKFWGPGVLELRIFAPLPQTTLNRRLGGLECERKVEKLLHPTGIKKLITQSFPQEATHYVDSSVPNGRNVLTYCLHLQGKRDSKNDGIRLLRTAGD
jgi:hypothetical protein